MSRASAETVYWVARINPRDQWRATYQSVIGLKLVTSDEVLDEVLAHFSAFGPAMRTRNALNLYEARPDKDYSLTDSASMVTIRAQAINEALMRDAHFVQEGFALLP
jgi:hypothetical protein